jgi:hypothetical protein
MERSAENGHQTDREMGSESLAGGDRGTVATLEKSRGKTEADPALLTAKKTPEEDEETENAAHTFLVEDEMNEETLGR